MRRVALRGLAWRKSRTLMTAIALVLGVGMISGTYVLTDTITRAFHDIFTSSYKNTSAVISGRQVVRESSSGNATVPQALLSRVRRLPGVAAAAGSLADPGSSGDSAHLVGHDGKAISSHAPTFGFGIDTSQPRFNPMHLVKGSWAAGPGQMAIDAGTADRHNFHIGERVGVVANGPVHRFRITGIAKFANVKSLGGATIAIFTIPTAQRLLDKRGQFDEISLAAKAGVSQEQLVREVRPLLPPSVQVKTASQQAKQNAKDVNSFLMFIQYFLLAFGGIALFVGAFVIFNTLTITVAQRTREFATLRTLGASRRQVLRSVLLEALAIGVIASVVGLLFGIALAKGLQSVFNSLGIDLPQANTVFKTRTAVVALTVGIVITLVASLIPALRATRVPPIAAVREGAVLPESQVERRSGRIGVAMVVAAVAALAYGSFGSLATGTTLLLIGLGCLALFVGVAVMSSRLVTPLAALVGQPAERLGGVAGRLARENSTRNPGRTARAAAALMIGLALVTVVATLGASLRSSDKTALTQQVHSDYVLTSGNGFDTFSAAAGRGLSGASGVTAASTVLQDRARIGAHSDVQVAGVDPATLPAVVTLRWQHGSTATLARMGSGGVVVKKAFADKHHLAVGSPLSLTVPSGRTLRMRVVGTTDPPVFDKIDPILPAVLMSARAFQRAFPRAQAQYTFVNTAGGAGPAATARLDRELRRYPDGKLYTRAAWIKRQTQGIDRLLNLLYVLLALSVIVSLFGMVNTLVLAVFERTRELGMLRAVGMTRRQVRRMIRHESVITGLIGAALGLPLGLFLAALVTKALSDQGLSYSLPLGSLVAFTIVAVIAGLLAAIAPARRAARIDVLAALQYE